MNEIMKQKANELNYGILKNDYVDLIDLLFTNNHNYKTPTTDIIKKDDRYVVEISLAGIDKKDINISIDNNLLIIECERKKGDGVLFELNESYYGKYRKEIRIPEHIDKEKIDATTNNGVLIITLPKNLKDINRNITIK